MVAERVYVERLSAMLEVIRVAPFFLAASLRILSYPRADKSAAQRNVERSVCTAFIFHVVCIVRGDHKGI